MEAYFWGTRGSLPAAFDGAQLSIKLHEALRLSRTRQLNTDADINDFIASLPFSVRNTYGVNTSCVEIRGGDDVILCDAGTGLRSFGHHASASGTATFHIFLSHPHWDHIQGFPFFIPAYIPGNNVVIYGGHPDIRGVFEAQQKSPFFPVSLSDMAASIRFEHLTPGNQYQIAGVRVDVISQQHPGGSFGYRFSRNGCTIVYSTDSEHAGPPVWKPDYPFIEFFRHADILIFDAQYALSDAMGPKEHWGHSSNVIAVELAVAASVRHLVLYHNEHTATDVALDKFLNDTRRYLSHFQPNSTMTIHLAYDGLKLPISSNNTHHCRVNCR